METTVAVKEKTQKKSKIRISKWENILENVLCLFVILSPIFDISSFLFRNFFNTDISISTFLRPIIPIVVGIAIFIKGNKKEKIFLLVTALIYLFYGIMHLIISKGFITGCSYGNIKNEMQYIFNFTFLIIDLIIYAYVFVIKKKDKSGIEKLKKAIMIMLAIYIYSIYLAIITKTSSYTYRETQTGYKGWIESGNSLSAILIILMFSSIDNIKGLTIKNTKENRWKLFSLITIILTSIYLVFLIGTRTGLLGVFLVLGIFTILEMIFSKNKKLIISAILIIIAAVLMITTVGSKTIQRRSQMNSQKYTIIDEATGEVGNMTGDMLRIKNKILNNELEENYMSEAQSKSVIELYEYAKKHNLEGNNTRRQQLMYNIYLVKNQKSILGILFGNGYKMNFREMVMENELASMALNFGILGFLLYIIPFIGILVYSAKQCIKDKNKISSNVIMYQCGLGLALVLSWMSGYVFFATSSMLIIVITSVLLISEVLEKSELNNKKKQNKETNKKAIREEVKA